MGIEMLLTVFVLLASACILVPLSQKLGLGSVIGYLLAGILIGPYALGLIRDPETALHVSEFGVVMMLFLIGLELKPRELWAMKTRLVGLGGAQICLTALVIFGFSLLLGLAWGEAALIGLALALSSTAIVLQILQERRIMETAPGRGAFSVLLFQDIAVIPIIALIPVFAAYAGLGDIAEQSAHAAGQVTQGAHGAHGEQAVHSSMQTPQGWRYAATLIGVFGGMILAGRLLLRPFFTFIAKSHVREIFTAVALALVIGATLLMEFVGLSAALGAFSAGVVLADSEYRHQLERDLEPFKALLLGLFFMSVGMSLNFDILLSKPLLIFGLTGGLIAVKFAVLFGLSLLLTYTSSDRLIFAGVLAQGSEFALVISQYGRTAGAIGEQNAVILNALVALSMAITPLLMIVIDRILKKRARPQIPAGEGPPAGLNNSVLIIGFGRMGQICGRILSTQGYDMTIIDHDPGHIEFIKRFGFNVYYGSGRDMDLLRLAGAQQAKLIILTTDDRDDTLRAAADIRENFPSAKLLVRARNRQHYFALSDLNIDAIERETFWSSVKMGQSALQLMGVSDAIAKDISDKFAKDDLATLMEQVKIHHNEEERIERGIAARRNLEETMQADKARREAAAKAADHPPPSS